MSRDRVACIHRTAYSHDNLGYYSDKYLIQHAKSGLSGGNLYATKNKLVYIG